MTHVITGSCCADAACVPLCPVDCIHPTPDEPDFGSAEMLYIDAATCIDCGACVDVCPVSAITTDYQLLGDVSAFEELSTRYFESGVPATDTASASTPAPAPAPDAPTFTSDELLRVAVVGAGPAGMYTVAALLDRFGDRVRINLIEKLPAPWGLLRYGVAPDHQRTKQLAARFVEAAGHPDVTPVFGVDVGVDVAHEELQASHHAVIYAVGAPVGRRASVPWIELEGSCSAADLVGWYNGHPDQADLEPELSHEHAVIIGNGNVALDVARMLLAGDDHLASTDVSPRALSALSTSAIRTVTILGRRGPEHAAFTQPELIDLMAVPGISLNVRGLEPGVGADLTPLTKLRVETLRRADASGASDGDRLLELSFWSRPERLLGAGHVAGVEIVDPRGVESTRTVHCGLVVSAVGFDRVDVPGLPQGAAHGVTYDGGRMIDPSGGQSMPGVYAVGWFKRGASGQLGTNRTCAEETVSSLAADELAGWLVAPVADAEKLRAREVIDLDGWLAIDRFERHAAEGSPAPRIKITQTDAMVRIAQAAQAARTAQTSGPES